MQQQQARNSSLSQAPKALAASRVADVAETFITSLPWRMTAVDRYAKALAVPPAHVQSCSIFPARLC